MTRKSATSFICRICSKPVLFSGSKLDPQGHIVHAECFAEKYGSAGSPVPKPKTVTKNSL